MLLDRIGSRAALAALLGLAALVSGPARSAERGSATALALNSITATELRHHVDVLADDAMEGRAAGSRGGRAAADYLAELLQTDQLQPAGEDGGYFQSFGNGYRNILGWIEGRDPKLKHEFILIGAHYDHVGYGARSNSFGPIGQIHNGADDNASGTAGVLEVIQAFTMLGEAPRRSVLFALWDGEEKGLLGSRYWMSHPTVSLESLKVAFNVDMIGRLRNQHLEVFGSRSAAGLRQLISRQNVDLGMELEFNWQTKANGDHYSFFERNVPFVMFHTGLHNDYHRPRDDADKINADGIQHVARLLFRTAWEMAERDQVPSFRSASRYESNVARDAQLRALPSQPPRLGIQWAPAKSGEGLTITQVTPRSAADQGGLRTGDQIVRFDGYAVTDDGRFPLLVLAAGSPAHVVLRRTGQQQPVELDVYLPGQPLRLGLWWQDDPGEPDSVVLNRITTGSAANLAGLVPGDRVYEVDGKTFSDDTEFAALVAHVEDTVRLLIERRGRLSEVTLHLVSKKSPPSTLAKPVLPRREPEAP